MLLNPSKPSSSAAPRKPSIPTKKPNVWSNRTFSRPRVKCVVLWHDTGSWQTNCQVTRFPCSCAANSIGSTKSWLWGGEVCTPNFKTAPGLISWQKSRLDQQSFHAWPSQSKWIPEWWSPDTFHAFCNRSPNYQALSMLGARSLCEES